MEAANAIDIKEIMEAAKNNAAQAKQNVWSKFLLDHIKYDNTDLFEIVFLERVVCVAEGKFEAKGHKVIHETVTSCLKTHGADNYWLYSFPGPRQPRRKLAASLPKTTSVSDFHQSRRISVGCGYGPDGQLREIN